MLGELPLMRALLLLLLLVSSGAWGADWHVCPDTDAANADLNYGDEDGTTEAKCFDGFADAWATAGDIDAGDTVYLHGTFYHERGYVADSGTSGSPIVIDGSDAVFWFSVDVSGDNTIATTPFGQGTGSSWQLVSGGVYKKGTNSAPYLMWVDGARVPNASTVPATQNDAGALAVLSSGQFISTTENLDGKTDTTYYYGTPTSDMRVNTISAYSATNSPGAFVVSGFNYITMKGLTVRGYYPITLESGGIFVNGCIGCIIEDPLVYENRVGIKVQANTSLSIYGTAPDLCVVRDGINGGINLAGQLQIMPLGVTQQVLSISNTNPARVVLQSANAPATNSRVIMRSTSGISNINDVEFTVTNINATTFDLLANVTNPGTGVDSTAWGAHTGSTGAIWVQSTDTGSTIGPYCYVHSNAPTARYNGINLDFSQDGDGIGIGYYGGTVSNIKITRNKLWNNGPRRALITGEAGNISKGSGIFFGTSYTHAVSNALVSSNDFYNNHRYAMNFDDVSSGQISGNIIRGTLHYGTTSGFGQLRIPANGPTTATYIVANNDISGESGSYGLTIANDTAGTKTYIVRNNNFHDLVGNVGTGATAWIGALNLASTQATVSESNNNFQTIQDDLLVKKSSTSYTTISGWQGDALAQGTDDLTAASGFVGGTSPTTAAGFKLTSGSALRRAGKDLNIGNVQDHGNRAFLHPPSIGAWETASGDEAAARSVRQ